MPVIAHSIPDSSSVSRTAASAIDSSSSIAPPGTAQLPLSVRRIFRLSPDHDYGYGWDEAVGLRRIGRVVVVDPLRAHWRILSNWHAASGPVQSALSKC